MNWNVLAEKMLEDIQVRMTHIHHAVKPVGYSSNLDKISVPEEDKKQAIDALSFLETWLTAGEESYCVLLGEYGLGKTTTCMLLTQALLEKRRANPDLPIPIYLDLRNISDKSVCDEKNLLSLIDAVLEHHPYGGASQNGFCAKDVIHLIQQEQGLIIFDGLDEVLVHMSTAAGQRFTHKILSILPPASRATQKNSQGKIEKTSVGRVLITCRTHYFRTLRDQKTHFTMQDRAGIFAKDYCVFTLLPFAKTQIYEYLKYSVPDCNTDSLMELIYSIHNLFELAERPYTLSLIPALIPEIERWKMEGSRITGTTVYRRMVHSWLMRDAGKHTFNMNHKLKLMEHLAAEMWRAGRKVWNVNKLEGWLMLFLQSQPDILEHYANSDQGALLLQIIEILKEDVRTATFLVRVGEADFRFAHSSLQEFFLASYLCHALTTGNIEALDMALVNKETLDFLGQILSEQNENECALAIQTLCFIRDKYRFQISEQGFAYMLLAHSKGYPTPSLEGICLDNANLKDWVITGSSEIKSLINIKDASFQNASLDNASLNYLDLKNVDFSGASLINGEINFCQAQGAIFKSAKLKGNIILHNDFEEADFTNAQIDFTAWRHCNLDKAQGLDTIPVNAVFTLCEPDLKFNNHLDTAADNKVTGHTALIPGCKFSPDGQQLASVSLDCTLRVWDVDTGQCLKLFKHDAWVLGCAFSQDGRLIASGASDKKIYIWDITKPEEPLIQLTGHQRGVRDGVFLSDEKFLSVSDDATIRIWKIKTGECVNILNGHKHPIRSCMLSPCHHYLASASDDCTVRIWDVATGQCLKILQGHTDWVRKCTYSVDGRYLISASADKTLRIWDVESGECVNILNGHKSKVRGCAVSPDGKYLASAAYDNTVRIWELITGECIKELHGHKERVRGCDFSVNGIMVSISDDLTMRLWNIETNECLHILGVAA